MPNSKMTSEQRSKIYSLYLRAWTLVKKDASVEVPFIEDLTLTASQWEKRAQRAEGLYPESASFTFREAWKDFLHRVPAVSFRQIRNFMMAVIAEGRNYDRDDTLADAKSRGTPVLCPISVQDIIKIQHMSRKTSTTADDASTKEAQKENVVANRLTKTMAVATAAARRVVESQRDAFPNTVLQKAEDQNLRLADFEEDHKEEVSEVQRESRVENYRCDYQKAYAQWKKDVLAAKKSPSAQQWQVLNLIHERCVYEHREESLHCVNATVDTTAWEPLFRLVHGLPGSGKSALIIWITNYFEVVWQWENGVHFVILAPLNSMAMNVSGQTLHSWGGISFKKSTGLEVGSGVVRKGRDNISQMHLKCARLRFMFIDECECVGATTAADIEQSVFNGVSTEHTYKLHTAVNIKKHITYRPFSGVNVFWIGDFYQLPPVGGTAVMSNPRSQSALENARVQTTLNRFWCCFDDANDYDALQVWSESFCRTGCRILDLDVNHRSGGDIWYSDLLTSCREGNMSVSDWQYLHGLPTNECGSWLVRQNKSMCGNPQCSKFKESTKAARLEGTEKWFEKAALYECQSCVQERKRRHRVLPSLKEVDSEDPAEAKTTSSGYQEEHVTVPDHLQAALSSSRFKECLFITRCNEPVGTYALQRSRLFAQATSSQLLWVQAEDYLDDPHFADLSMAEKVKRKSPWLHPHFHTRRTGGIPSLLPLCYDLPMRCTFADYGGRNHALVVIWLFLCFSVFLFVVFHIS